MVQEQERGDSGRAAVQRMLAARVQGSQTGAQGRGVQVDSIEPCVVGAHRWFQRWKLEHHTQLSTFPFKFDLRRYIKE